MASATLRCEQMNVPNQGRSPVGDATFSRIAVKTYKVRMANFIQTAPIRMHAQHGGRAHIISTEWRPIKSGGEQTRRPKPEGRDPKLTDSYRIVGVGLQVLVLV